MEREPKTKSKTLSTEQYAAGKPASPKLSGLSPKTGRLRKQVSACQLNDLPTGLAKKITINETTGCWVCRGTRERGGYVRINWEGRRWLVHRLVYTLLVGPIEDGLTIDHVKDRGCRDNACCWPGHLEPVTRGVNSLRGTGPAALNATKTTCDNGHDYTPANTFVRRDGRRECRECMRGRAKRWYYEVAEREGRVVVPYGNRTHCPSGHEYTEENSYWHRGKRHCRICSRERVRQRRIALAAAQQRKT